MLPGLVKRELTLAVRDTGLRIGLLVYLLAVLASGIVFVVQGLGAAGMEHGTAGEATVGRVLAVPWVLCGFFLPWAWWRMTWREQGGDLLRWSVRCGAAPGQLTLAKLVAGHLCLLETVALSLPLLVLAWETTLTPANALVLGILDLLAFLVLAATAIVGWNLTARGEMVALGLSYLTLVALALFRRGLVVAVGAGGTIAANLVLAALITTLLVFTRRSRLRELEVLT